MKKLWYSKTFWVNLIGLIISVLATVENPEYLPYAASGIAAANIALRLVTNEGVGFPVKE